jgi:hypothetical protein
MLKTIIISLTIMFTAACGSFWWLGFLAFGDARVSGVNAIPAAIFVLVIFAAIFFGIYLIFASLDWVNDLVAQKSVKRDRDEVKDLRGVTSLVAAQTRALAGLKKAGPPEAGPTLGDGGLLFEDDTFDQI